MRKVRRATSRADLFVWNPDASFSHAAHQQGGASLDAITAGLRQLYADLLRQPVPPQFVALNEEFETRQRRGGHET
jgi:hypothetical protein